MVNKGGPYFQNQKPCRCGCYYPDVLRIKDEAQTVGVVRTYDCITHGRSEVSRPEISFDPDIPSLENASPASLEELRKNERQRLRRL